MEKIERSIKELKNQLKEMELKQTPKFHILVDQIITQVHKFGVISDLAEDFVEKSHKIRNQLNDMTAHMSSQYYREQEPVNIRRKWMIINSLVQQHIAVVKESPKGVIERLLCQVKK